MGVPSHRRGPVAAGHVLVAGLTATVLLLGGCAQKASPAASEPAATSEFAAPSTAPLTGADPAEASRAAEQYAANTPPAAAEMVCGEEISGLVAGALGLSSAPVPRPAWADHVYTCTYALANGTLVLAVTVTPSDAAAAQDFARLRQERKADAEEPGLGPQAFSAADGVVLAVKDNMVLLVDPTRLPDDLGLVHEHRIDLARILTVAVFNCWTGN